MSRILIVTEDMSTANLVKCGLEGNGYEVVIANGKECDHKNALEEKGSYNLFIVDVMKGAGLIVQELRENKFFPILVLSSSDSTDDIVAGLNAGADGYLTKPFSIAELDARIRAILRRYDNGRGAEINIADLRIDPVSHKVWRNCSEIILSDRGYDLLLYLACNPDQVFTSSTIAKKVWPNKKNKKLSNIVAVYINYLRRKIDNNSDNKLIHTVRRAGYVFRSPSPTVSYPSAKARGLGKARKLTSHSHHYCDRKIKELSRVEGVEVGEYLMSKID